MNFDEDINRYGSNSLKYDFMKMKNKIVLSLASILTVSSLNASELSHKVHFPCCTRTDTPPNSSDFLPIFYANYCKKFKINLKRF